MNVSMELDLPHPPAKVWRALTEPDLLAAWLMANDLHKRLRYSWRRGPASSPLDTAAAAVHVASLTGECEREHAQQAERLGGCTVALLRLIR